MGPPGQNGFEDLHPAFVGFTPTTFTANLAGRSGADAKCNAAYAGSHFCTDWEVDETNPPPIATTAWVDAGNSETSSRFFRASYSTTDIYTCAGWTSASASGTPDGYNLQTGKIYTALGGLTSSFVAGGDGGCETARSLACCMGGTTVRFRGFTASHTGKLNGRSGANQLCETAFSGSHFCTDWEADQAAIHGIPGSGAWVDAGNSAPTTRLYHQYYQTTDIYTCAGWTTDASNATPDGYNLATGHMLSSLGGLTSSFVAGGDGGCEVSRPLACCDGMPPQ
jgi:hypothetical protein